MGKIHEALQRAEEQRTALGGARGGAVQASEVVEAPALPRRVSRPGNQARAARRSRIVLSEAESAVSEQYRTLRARIQSIRRTRPLRSIAITSALPGEGKTTTAVNLALSFGFDIERETCLVDADMRTPGVHRAFSEQPVAGLAEVLQEDAKLEEALIRVPDTRLSVLSVKALPAQPSELLASRRMTRLMEELYGQFETVLIDCPPILGLPDATTLVDLADVAVLVVARGGSAREELENSLERIDVAKVLGTVFNRSPEVASPYGYGRGGA